MFPRCINDLIECFKKFPGVGQKSAERMAFSFLDSFDSDDRRCLRRVDGRRYEDEPSADAVQDAAAQYSCQSASA